MKSRYTNIKEFLKQFYLHRIIWCIGVVVIARIGTGKLETVEEILLWKKKYYSRVFSIIQILLNIPSFHSFNKVVYYVTFKH